MSWFQLGTAALGTAGDIFGGSGQAAAPLPALSGNTPVTVSVGGLNVPAYPNFPRFSNETTGQVQEPTIVNDSRMFYLAGAVVAAVVILRLAK